MSVSLKRVPAIYWWLLLALLLLALFVVYTALVTSDSLAALTVRQEQWLLQRPLARFDCVVYQWRYLGEAPVSLALLLIICVVCIRLKYRLRFAFALLLLFSTGIGVEVLGKQYVAQPVPAAFGTGMEALGCPQIWRVSHLKLIPLSLGVASVAPAAPSFRVAEKQAAASAVFSLSGGSDDSYFGYTGYPSGHSYRWMLIGLVALWLTWRQVRKRFLRGLLMLVFLALAFAGGIAQFYTGAHLFTDMIGGYLLGALLACCAIAVLRATETRNRWAGRVPCDLSVLPIAEKSDTLSPEKL